MKNRRRHEQKTQTRIVRGLIDHDARHFSATSPLDRAYHPQCFGEQLRGGCLGVAVR